MAIQSQLWCTPVTALSPPRPLPLAVQVEKAEQDKQSAIIRAQGEAQSATLIGQALQQNPAFLTLRYADGSWIGGGWVSA